jgi:hypothetical protein
MEILGSSLGRGIKYHECGFTWLSSLTLLEMERLHPEIGHDRLAHNPSRTKSSWSSSNLNPNICNVYVVIKYHN